MSVAIKTEQVILESTEELDEELQLQLEDSGGESYQIEYTEQQIPHSRQRHNSGSQQNSNMNSSKNSGSNNNGNNKNMLESEKRIRREIANSNERRRMQSINAGFQNLRSLLPRHEGEKLSKAAILQQTSHYICELENQKTQLLQQNSQLKRQLGQHESSSGPGNGNVTDGSNETIPVNAVAVKKRKITDNVINIQAISDSSDEGLGSMSPEPMTLLSASNAQIAELKKQLDKERRVRNMLEDELQMIKRQLYSVATAPTTTGVTTGTTYIPREVIEHTDNLMREDELEELGTVSYVEIDEMTGQQQVVVCSSIEELDPDAVNATEIITDDNVQEEVILSSNSSTESEHEVKVNAIAKAYAAGSSPAVLQPILQAAIKATPKVEVERINEAIIKVKTEKIEQPGLTRSRQNLETIVEAIRHLEGDHLFADGNGVEQKLQQQRIVAGQEAPLALTTKQQQAQRNAIANELRPFLHIKNIKDKQITILTRKPNKDNTTTVLSNSGNSASLSNNATVVNVSASNNNATVMPTAIFKVQTANNVSTSGSSSSGSAGGGSVSHGGQVTITTSALKQQCRPGVIVAKQLS